MATQRRVLLIGSGDSGRFLSAEEFEEAGFEPYWSIDRLRRRVTVYVDEDGRYRKTVLHPGGRYGSRFLPGLEIPIDSIF
jgi:Uma2 family endonuclease